MKKGILSGQELIQALMTELLKIEYYEKTKKIFEHTPVPIIIDFQCKIHEQILHPPFGMSVTLNLYLVIVR